ncbi:hypothetical protein GCM10027162_75080 [Streptomyces incanus]
MEPAEGTGARPAATPGRAPAVPRPPDRLRIRLTASPARGGGAGIRHQAPSTKHQAPSGDTPHRDPGSPPAPTPIRTGLAPPPARTARRFPQECDLRRSGV